MRTSAFIDLHEKAFHRSALWTAPMMVVLLTLFRTARATASPPDIKTIVGKMAAHLGSSASVRAGGSGGEFARLPLPGGEHLHTHRTRITNNSKHLPLHFM
jgi:hypothetical protein